MDSLDVLDCLDEVPGEAWRRAKCLFFDPMPEKVFGLSLILGLLSFDLGGRPRFLVGFTSASSLSLS